MAIDRTVIHDLVETARAGKNPDVICRLEAGWVAFSDSPFLKGHCVIWSDPVVFSINDLSENQRMIYSRDVCRVGDALIKALGAYRVNYETMCNGAQALHTHIIPRYKSEPDSLRKERPAIAYANPVKLTDMKRAELLPLLRKELALFAV